MLSKTSRKDVAKDKASDLASAVADAAEAGRDKIAPVARNVTGHLSDAADKASEAAAPHVAKAKEAVVEAAAPQVVRTKEATAEAAGAAAPQVKKARKAAKQAAKDAGKVTASTADRAEAAGLTKEQVHRLFAEEWMPRIQQTIAATTAAGAQAYAALPQQARDTVETVAPQVAKKRRKKGKVLIALGLLAGAGAVALYVSGQKNGAKAAPQVTAPEIERLDVNPVEETTSVPTSDDAVGDLEKKVDASVTGSRRGRHAAKE